MTGSATSGVIEPYNGARRILHGSRGGSCGICDPNQPEKLSGIPMAVWRCAQRLLLGGTPFCCGCWRALQLQHLSRTLARRAQETIVQVREKSVIGLVANCGSHHSPRECRSPGSPSTIHCSSVQSGCGTVHVRGRSKPCCWSSKSSALFDISHWLEYFPCSMCPSPAAGHCVFFGLQILRHQWFQSCDGLWSLGPNVFDSMVEVGRSICKFLAIWYQSLSLIFAGPARSVLTMPNVPSYLVQRNLFPLTWSPERVGHRHLLVCWRLVSSISGLQF